eukprot:1499846-Lingulodinium_polyedra.AAC.1
MKNADVIEVRGFTSWNTRWTVDPNSEKTVDKKAVIQTMVDAGTVVLLQETHWTRATAAMWASGVFPHTAVVQTCARKGPRGGAQGGAAILIPAPLELIWGKEMIPGCA